MYPVSRLLGILLTPKTEWQAIRDDKLSNLEIFLKYVVWLALLPVIGYLLSAFNYGSFLLGLRAAIIGYVVALASIDLSAYVINAMAATFNATKEVNRALKLIGFGATPIFVAAALRFIPYLGAGLWIAGAAYCAYLFYLGIPELLATPEDRRIAHSATAFVIFIVVFMVLALIAGGIFGVSLIGRA